MNKPEKSGLPYTCTPAYNREACKKTGCVCSTCFQQEFCDRCSDCSSFRSKKESCYRYEGSFNY